MAVKRSFERSFVDFENKRGLVLDLVLRCTQDVRMQHLR
jgi:hypothetical protein